MGRRGYKEINSVIQRAELELFDDEARGKLPQDIAEFNHDNPLCQWLVSRQDILDKEQIELDPEYEQKKHEWLAWFNEREIELIIPLVFEKKVVAFLGLGKKESLQAYTAKDADLLKKLGREAGVTVYNALHYEDLIEKERLEEEMKMGRHIQVTLLPQVDPKVEGLAVCGLMQPAKEIGGDYYDFITLPSKDEFAVVIGDVSGKGVAAGLVMSMTKATVYAFSQEGVSPKQILLRTNHVLYHHISGEKFMTLLYMLWQHQTRTLTYSSAGHEHILCYRHSTQEIEIIQSGGFMLGMLPDIETYLDERAIKLEPSDKIVLYTDGVTEAQSQSGDRYGLHRLREALQKYARKPAGELAQAVKDDVYEFMGKCPQYDDITLVVLEAQ